MSHPIISVLMPAYNAEKYIEEAIDSILKQTFSNFEFIIIDDGSTDRTLDIIKSIKDTRIKLIQNGGNKGLIYTLNYGLTLAQGKYIARMDADDISQPERLQKQYEYMEVYSDVSVLGTGFLFMHNNRVHRHPTDDKEIRIKLMEGTAFAHPTVMMRKADIELHNLSYNIHYPSAEDYKLWTEYVFLNLKLANLSDVLLNYRVHDSQVSSRKREEQKAITSEIRKGYINTLFDSIFSESELDIINNRFKCVPFSDVLPIIIKLRNSNKQKLFFDEKLFDKYLCNKMALSINKNGLFYMIKSDYSVFLKFWILRKYLKRIFKNIFI